MIGKKINQLATELAPTTTDLTIIGDPISGVSKKITLAQLGAIFSGAVSFYNDLASFPVVGDINVIYCAKDTQKLYLWSGSAYTEVFPSQALLDTYQLRSEKGVSNGYASLDSGGKVPISQLPSSIMEYKGTWNAATNTPTLANGTGDTGDVYICNVAGTVNFGAGPITFAVGDYTIYSGSIWQRSSGAVGTVTSVGASITGDSITISNSPISTSGTLAFAFAGTSAQYINGAGSLTTFPTSLISGTGNVNAIPKFTANTVLGNSVMEDDGNFVSMRGLKLNTIGGTGNTINFQQGSGIIAAGLGYSSIGAAGSTGIQFYLDQNVTERIFVFDTTTITSNTARTYSMPNSSGTLALTSDIPSLTGYVPYTGATANVDLGTHTLSAYNLIINHTSGSGVAASITKGGSGEALTVVKSSGSGNAASITGGVTLLSELHLTTDLADAYIASASNWNTAYNSRIVSVVGPITFSLNTLGITQATGSSNGYLSSADWTTFNNKQSALTNPVTGTGTTNYLPKFTGTSTIGNSLVRDDGSGVSIGFAPQTDKLFIYNASGTNNALQIQQDGTGDIIRLNGNGGANRLVLQQGGNLGLGVTPSAWGAITALELANGVSIASYSAAAIPNSYLTNNAFYNGSNWIYKVSSFAATMQTQTSGGSYAWNTAPSGTAGNAISFTQAMTLNASGNLSVGNTNDTYKLDVSGTGRFSGDVSVIKSSDASFIVNNTSASGKSYRLVSKDDGKFYIQNTGVADLFNIASTGAATFSSSVRTTDRYLWGTATNGTTGQIVTDNTNNYFDYLGTLFIRAAASSATRLTILESGAATFSSSVKVNGTPAATSGILSVVTSTSTLGATADLGLLITNDGTNGKMSQIGFGYSESRCAAVIGGIISNGSGATTSDLFFATRSTTTGSDAPTERMRITSGGNVGIGTTSPAHKLDVTSSGFNVANFNSTYGQMAISFANNGTSFATLGSGVSVTPSAGANDVGIGTSGLNNAIVFATGTGYSERMRITSGGDVLVGTTNSDPSGSGVQGIAVRGDGILIVGKDGAYAADFGRNTSDGEVVRFRRSGTTVGSISVTGSATAYNTSSDYRLKTDYKDFSGLDLVSKIKAYDYEWKSDKSRSYGVIAHELQSVINYAVTGVKDGKEMQGVDYSKIVPVLIKAIQELNDKIK